MLHKCPKCDPKFPTMARFDDLWCNVLGHGEWKIEPEEGELL